MKKDHGITIMKVVRRVSDEDDRLRQVVRQIFEATSSFPDRKMDPKPLVNSSNRRKAGSPMSSSVSAILRICPPDSVP